jgi:hypothetical protein
VCVSLVRVCTEAAVLEELALAALYNQELTEKKLSFFFLVYVSCTVATVLEDPALNALWNKELTEMSTRITDMRAALVSALKDIK